MDLPSGSPQSGGFDFFVVGDDGKLRSNQRPASPEPASNQFVFRVVKDSSDEPEPVSKSVESTDDEEIVLPDFEVSASSVLQEPPEPPNLGRIAKTTAVRVLMNHSARNRELKSVCDRIYTNFFRSFSEWNVNKAMKKRRKQTEIETIDEGQVYEARRSYESLKQEAERWTASDPTVPALRIRHWSGVEAPPRAEIDTREIENLITGLDRLARDVSRCGSSTMDLNDLQRKLAESMHASLV